MYQILGIQDVRYVSKKTNREVIGVNLHCIDLEGSELPSTRGQAVERLFLSSSSPAYKDACELEIGSVFYTYYNRYGNIDGIKLVEED